MFNEIMPMISETVLELMDTRRIYTLYEIEDMLNERFNGEPEMYFARTCAILTHLVNNKKISKYYTLQKKIYYSKNI